MAKHKHPTSRKAEDEPFLLSDERIVDAAELLERVPLDRSTIWRMVQEKRFPAPIQLTEYRIGWRWSSVLAWLAEREANPIKARSYFGRDKENTKTG